MEHPEQLRLWQTWTQIEDNIRLPIEEKIMNDVEDDEIEVLEKHETEYLEKDIEFEDPEKKFLEQMRLWRTWIQIDDFISLPIMKDFVGIAPDLVSKKIFDYLEIEDLGKCRSVQKSWKNLIENQLYYWKRVISAKRDLFRKDKNDETLTNWGNLLDKFLSVCDIEKLRKIVEITKNDFEIEKKGQSGYIHTTETDSIAVYIQKDRLVRETPLHKAAKNGDIHIFKFLEKYVDDVNPRDCFGCTPLFIATEKGDLGLVKYIVRVIKAKIPNYQDKDLNPNIREGRGNIR